MQDVSLTDPSSLIGDTANQLEKLFSSGVAGAIPNGRGKGTVLIGTGGPLARLAAALAYALAWRGKVVNAREGRLKNLGLVFWGRRHVLDFALDFRQGR